VNRGRTCRAWSAIGLFLALAGGFEAPDALAASELGIKWAWTLNGDGIGGKGLKIVDVDGDGEGEIFATADSTQYWYELEFGPELSQVWSSLPYESELRALDVAVWEGGAIAVVLTRDSLVVVDAVTKAQIDEFPTDSEENQALAVADFDGDGVVEAAVCDTENFYRYELATGANTATKWGFGCGALAIGEIDGDAAPEIALAGNVSGGYVLDGVSLAVDWGDLDGFGNRVDLGDVDGDGRDEVVSLYTGNGYLRVQDPQTGELLWSLESSSIHGIVVADFEPAPGEEVAYLMSGYSLIFVADGSSGQVLREVQSSAYSYDSLAAGDVTGDGNPELFWGGGDCCSGESVLRAALNGSTSAWAQTADLLGPLAGVVAGDFSGDGIVELASMTPGYYYNAAGQVLTLSMDDGRLRRHSDSPLPSLSIGTLVAGQLDNDDPLELCIGSTYYSSEASIACLDGVSLQVEWSAGIPGYPNAMLVAEIDSGGFPEILATDNSGHVRALEGESGWLKWQSPDYPGGWSFGDLQVIDHDSDGEVEVMGGATTYYGSRLQTFSADSGALLAPALDLGFTAMSPRAAEPYPPTDLFVALQNDTIRSVHPVTGTLGPVVATFPEQVESFVILDLTRDGVEDVVGLTSQGFVHLFDGAVHGITWTSPYVGFEQAGERLLGGDLDGNSVPEVIVATLYGLILVQGPLFELFLDGFESGDTAAWDLAVP
jgi:hypothetical protein